MQGGTGISTIPTYGQIPVGNSSGNYTLTATSTLGIAGGSGSSTYVTVCGSGCDYTTDGTADDVQINQAAADLSSSGGTIYIKKGTYAISTPISVYSNQTIMGERGSTVLRLDNGKNTYVVGNQNRTTGNAGITLRDLVVDGNYLNQTSGTGALIEFIKTSSSTVDHVFARNGFFKGIYFQQSDDNKVINSEVYNAGANGIDFFASSTRNLIDSNYVHAVRTYVGILLNRTASHNIVTNNVVASTSDDGIQIRGYLPGSYSEGNIIANNRILNAGIGPTLDGVTPQGQGILLNIDGSRDNTVTGNYIYRPRINGIEIGSTTGAILSGNTIVEAGYNGAVTGAGGEGVGILVNETAASTTVMANQVYGAFAGDYNVPDGNNSHIYGSLRINNESVLANTPLVISAPQSGNNVIGAQVFANGTSNAGAYAGYGFRVSGLSAGIDMGQIRFVRTNLPSNTDGEFQFLNNGGGGLKQNMVLTSGGQLGIGTTTPLAKLSAHLNAADTYSNAFAIGSSTLVATTTLFRIDNTGSTTIANGINITGGCYALNGACFGGTVNAGTSGQLPYYAGAGSVLTATSTIFVDTNSLVGIGTALTTSGYATTIASNSSGNANSLQLWNSNAATSNTGPLLGFRTETAAGASTAYIQGRRVNTPNNGDTALVFANQKSGALAESLRIDTAGFVGVGTSTPFSRLHVTSGANATTTVNFGEVGSATSKACFNTKNTAGADISFYFVGTAIVTEASLCK